MWRKPAGTEGTPRALEITELVGVGSWTTSGSSGASKVRLKVEHRKQGIIKRLKITRIEASQ
jgi:hypothetical protein